MLQKASNDQPKDSAGDFFRAKSHSLLEYRKVGSRLDSRRQQLCQIKSHPRNPRLPVIASCAQCASILVHMGDPSPILHVIMRDDYCVCFLESKPEHTSQLKERVHQLQETTEHMNETQDVDDKPT